MDGFQTATAIRSWERTVGGHLPIVAMTASALSDEHDRCRNAGMDRFITKPFSQNALYRALEELSVSTEPSAMPPELAGRAAFLAGLGDDEDLAKKLVEIFVEQSASLMTQVRGAIDAADAEGLRRAAHALKGTISNFPAGPARIIAARMETLGFDKDLVGAREALPELEREVQRLRELLPALI